MDWLNYHHLLYFWVTAREGSIARASAHLHLTQPTISAQIRQLERVLGEPLFQRKGRGLELTDVGRMVQGYADEIFGLGRELLDTVRRRPTGRPLRFRVGVADVVPKLIAWRLLAPAFSAPSRLRLEVREDHHERLLQLLASHQVDVVLSDAPVGSSIKVKAFNHLLAEGPLAFFGTAKLVAPRRRRFPQALDGAPLLAPSRSSALRGALDQWFDELGVRPDLVGEFDDLALMKVAGGAGLGIFPAPADVGPDVRRSHRVVELGRTDAVLARYYAISVERRIRHPAVLAITAAGRGPAPAGTRPRP